MMPKSGSSERKDAGMLKVRLMVALLAVGAVAFNSGAVFADLQGTTSEADFNQDHIVNWLDFGVLAQNWQRTDCGDEDGWCSGSDIDHSGDVGWEDFSVLANQWLMTSSVFVEAGDQWRYAKGFAGAVGADWNQKDFDDSGWMVGPSGIGYADGDDATILSDMLGNYLTVYTRRSFKIGNLGQISALKLEIDYDDGFVAYLNGKEIARRNLGQAGDPVDYNTETTDGREAGSYEVIGFANNGFVVEGDNVLAVEVHNWNIDSSDMSLIPRLVWDVEYQNASPVAYAGEDRIVTEGDVVTLDGSGSYDPEGNAISYAWQQISGPNATINGDADSIATFTAPAVASSTIFGFRLSVSDGELSASDSVLVGVNDNGNTVNHPPVADDQSVITSPGVAKAVTLRGSDQDGDELTFIIVTYPVHGSISGQVPHVTYTPENGYEGSDSFAFTVNDGTSDSQAAIVSITINSPGVWVPPIGIPRPEFGIDQTNYMFENDTYDFGSGPEPYKDAGNGPYTHYVDNTHPNATDSNNNYGTASQPRLTIPGGNFSAGSVVEIHGGPYSPSSDRFWIRGTGTASKPIIIRGGSPDNRPELTGFIHLQGSYMIAENLTLLKKHVEIRPYDVSAIDHIAVRNVHGGSSGGATVYIHSYDASRTIDNIVIYNNHIHHNGNSESSTENDVPGVAVGRYVHNLWIVDNNIHHNGGDSIILAHNTGFTSSHIYIGRNVMHDDRENAVDIKECSDVVVSQNTMYGYRPTNTSEGATVVVHYGSRRIWLLANDMYDSQYGVSCTGAEELYVVGNVVHNMRSYYAGIPDTSAYRPGAGIRAYHSSQVHAIGNTVYDVVVGLAFDLSSTGSRMYIVNNIISQIVAADNGYHILTEGEDSAHANSDMNNNLLYQSGGPVRILWDGATYDVAGFINGAPGQIGLGEGCLSVDPKLVDPAGGNFDLQSNSPAIDAGVVPDVVGIFNNLYGIDIGVDFDGTDRPQGSTQDIGSHESP